MNRDRHAPSSTPSAMRWWPFLLVFASIALVLPWQSQDIQLRDVLPSLILLACPLLHLLASSLHGGRDTHERDRNA